MGRAVLQSKRSNSAPKAPKSPLHSPKWLRWVPQTLERAVLDPAFAATAWYPSRISPVVLVWRSGWVGLNFVIYDVQWVCAAGDNIPASHGHTRRIHRLITRRASSCTRSMRIQTRHDAGCHSTGPRVSAWFRKNARGNSSAYAMSSRVDMVRLL